jgi:hypothetical protein
VIDPIHPTPMSARGYAWAILIAAVGLIAVLLPAGPHRELALAGCLAAVAVIGASIEVYRLVHRRPVPPVRSPLSGRVALASYFQGRDGRRWSPTEIEHTRRALDRAADWLNREAADWGIPLHVERSPIEVVALDDSPRPPHPLGPDAQEHFDQISDTAEWLALLRAASAGAIQNGYPDLPSLIAALSARANSDTVVWFLHSLSRGQSFALEDQHTGIPGLRLAVCYAREGTPHGPHDGPVFADPITFLHELLHLFGATDKYGRSLQRYPRGQLTPHDIMFLGYESLTRLRIDPLTAREIGWWDGGPLPEPIQRRTRRPGTNRNGGST